MTVSAIPLGIPVRIRVRILHSEVVKERRVRGVVRSGRQWLEVDFRVDVEILRVAGVFHVRQNRRLPDHTRQVHVRSVNVLSKAFPTVHIIRCHVEVNGSRSK